MSKPSSGYFVGTQGHKNFLGNENFMFVESMKDAEEIIAERVMGLDTREHTIKHKKYLSKKQIKEIKKKIEARTATMEEYKNMRMSERLNERRAAGVDAFYETEKERIINGLPTTRKWTQQQKDAILAGKKPKYNGKTMHAHHTYSVKKYPHLANRGEVIFPTTFQEHLYEWHGGNWNNSLPGRRIKKNRRYKNEKQ